MPSAMVCRSSAGGHLHDRLHQRGGPHVRGHGLDELAVDLHHVGRETAQVTQRGVAGAVVVDGDGDPAVPEGGDHVRGAFQVQHEGALGDLENQQVTLVLVRVEHGGDAVGQVVIDELTW